MSFRAVLMVALALSSSTINSLRLAQEDAIREAVFRYQFGHNASGYDEAPTTRKPDVYCIAMGGEVGGKMIDPSQKFMKRFAGQRPPVRKASACTYAAAMSASDDIYTVKRTNGKWRVTDDKVTSIAENSNAVQGHSRMMLIKPPYHSSLTLPRHRNPLI
jgi:hypothetical protein